LPACPAGVGRSGGAALLVGPRKIMRVGVAVLPLLAKLRR
jgi:hypothetical protein